MLKLPKAVQALLDPGIYPEGTEEVKLLQTQISFIFLAGDFVYKLKKPVDFGFLDFTTLEKRKFFCWQEVELNRRLCPEIYLGVVPLVRSKGGFSLGGEGEVADYLVKMRRLPQERTMDKLLEKDEVSPQMVEKVAAKLADFHRWAKIIWEDFGDLKTCRFDTEENFAQTKKYIDLTISLQEYERIKLYTRSFLERNASLFEQRVKEGRVKDCHGDLHLAHICFSDEIYIFDCIEFNDRFRYLDVASEVAFLAMDLDRHEREDLSRHFVESYIGFSGDQKLKEILDFYKCYRAYVRGKVESFKLDDPHISRREEVQQVAKKYFNLAYSYTFPHPILFITCGLIGTGKTALAQELSQKLGIPILSSDTIRKKLAGISPEEHRFEDFGKGIYSADFSHKTYSQMLAEAEEILKKGSSVILDASFRRQGEREKALSLAKRLGADFLVLECTCPEKVAAERLGKRHGEGSVSDGRLEIFSELKANFEPVVEVPTSKHFRLDTSLSTKELVSWVLERI